MNRIYYRLGISIAVVIHSPDLSAQLIDKDPWPTSLSDFVAFVGCASRTSLLSSIIPNGLITLSSILSS